MPKFARASTIALAAVLAVLAAPVAVGAQSTAPRRTRKTDLAPAPPKTNAVAPAPAAPAPAPSTPVLEPRASDQGSRVAALIGIEASLEDNVDSVLKLQVEASTELRRIGPAARFDGVFSVGFIPYSKDISAMGIATKFESNTFELVPAFRFAFALGPQFTFHADTGLGLAYVTAKTTITSPYRLSTSTDSWGELLRFAAGLAYDVNDQFRLGARLGLDIHFDDVTTKALPVLVEASWRL